MPKSTPVDVTAIEARLAELERRLALSADEQIERVRLKKLKLAEKDRQARRAR